MSLQQLHTKITKIKNQISKSNNYLQLEQSIVSFQKLKGKVIKKLQLSKNRKSDLNDQNQGYEREQLFQTCQQLIKQKIKYFKKIAVKKMQKQKQQIKIQQQKIKKSSAVKLGQQHILSSSSSNFSNSHHKLLTESPSSLLNSRQMKQLRQLNNWSSLVTENQGPDQDERTSLATMKPSAAQRTGKRLKQSRSVDNLSQKIQRQKGKQTLTFENQKVLFNNRSKQARDEHLNRSSGNVIHRNNHGNSRCEQGQYQLDDDNKTQIKATFMKRPLNNYTYDSLHNNSGTKQPAKGDELEYYRQKLHFLQQFLGNNGTKAGGCGNNSQSNRYLQENSQLFDQIYYKLREKSLQLQELKGRIKYYEQTTQQLKSRVFSQQKRCQDYIQGLKKQIHRQHNLLYQKQKQKKLISQVIRQYEFKFQVQEKQKMKMIEQIQSMLKERQRQRQSEKGNTKDLRKQLQVMAQQENYIRQLQKLIKQQNLQSSISAQKNQSIQKELNVMKQQLHNQLQEKQTLQQLLQLKLQEIESFKTSIYQLKRQVSELQQQLLKASQQLNQCHKIEEQLEKRKENTMKKKIDKLKEVKSLLSNEA